MSLSFPRDMFHRHTDRDRGIFVFVSKVHGKITTSSISRVYMLSEFDIKPLSLKNWFTLKCYPLS